MAECLEQLREAEPVRRAEVLTTAIRERLAAFLGFDSIEDVSADETFAELGADSSQAVEFKLILDDLLGLRLSAGVLFEHPTAGRLAEHLLGELGDIFDATGNGAPVRLGTPRPIGLTTPSPGFGHGEVEIAIVSVACRFPGASDPDALFRRSLASDYLRLGDHPRLDYGRLGELAGDDRMARLASETVEQLLERLRGRRQLLERSTGVFVNADSRADGDGTAYRVPLANRISFDFDLQGPSETINAFCAGSYLALHRASQAIRSGECRQAIVGGVNVIDGEAFRRAADAGSYRTLLSADNRIHSFGRRACGFVRCEGAGLVFLKTLEDAEADGDEVLALVRGVVVRHGGRGFSLEAPNVAGMAETALRCLNGAGLHPVDVDYLEAHGIGNPLADALELAALHRVYRPERPGDRWHLSCVKPSVGHPEQASGMASLIKAVQAIKARTLPPLATAMELTEELPDGCRFRFEPAPVPWSRSGGPRRVALNTYSIGGLNAHVILEEFGERRRPPSRPDGAVELPPPLSSAATIPVDGILDGWAGPAAARLVSIAAEVFGLPTGEIAPSRSPLELGFDSLKVVEFVQRVNEDIGLGLTFSEMMTLRTFGDLLARPEPVVRSRASLSVPIHPVTVKRIAATETQRGMWYVGEVLGRSTSFNIPIAMRLRETLDVERFERAIENVLGVHPALRVRFVSDPAMGELVQEVMPAPGLVTLERVDLDAGDSPHDWMTRRLRQPLPISEGPLLRAFHVRHFELGEYVFLVVHHLVVDGFSAVRFVDQLWRQYRDPTVARPTPADFGFAEFAEWERNYLSGGQAEEDRRYWLDELSGVAPRVDLPYDIAHVPEGQEVGVGCQSIDLDAGLLDGLRELAAACHAPSSAVMLATFLALLGRLSSQDDLAVTTPVGLRPLHRLRESIGCFINLVVTRARLDGSKPFIRLVRDVRDRFAAGIDRSSFPYARLLPELGLSLNRPVDSVFPISFTYQNIFDEWGGSLDICGLARVELEVYQEVEDDLTLEVYDFRGSMRLNLKYRKSAFLHLTVRRILEGYRALLRDAIDHPESQLCSLDVLDDSHRRLLLDQFSGADRPGEEHGDLLALIDRWADARPGSAAVVWRGETTTYADLRRRSFDLALDLERRGIRPGDVVGLRVPRSADLIVGMLAIMRAGAAYLPLDPALSDALLDERLVASGAVGFLDECLRLARFAPAPGRPDGTGGLAYVLFTSGSTGKPKGVGIRLGSLAHLCRAMVDLYGITTDDRVLLFASPTFDMSVEEMFPALTAGAAVVVREEEDLAPARFERLVADRGVTIVNLPPSFHDALRVMGDDRLRALYGRLRILAFGGDRLPDETLRFLAVLPTRVFNVYGPTECTVNVSAAELTGGRHAHIGRPLTGVRVYILSEGLELLPPGVRGELCVAGRGVAPGYLDPSSDRRPSFVPDPFGAGLLYRTGDRARWRPDGNLEFLGRLDDQLSILGHRVEPAEVEAALLEHPDVDRVAVIGRPDQAGRFRLIAFYEARRDVDLADWRAWLRDRLPAYVVPSAFRRVDLLPHTDNGKIDRRRLADIPVVEETRPDYAPPASPTERLVAAAFERRTGIAPVGMRDNFFDLGGHSLMAIQITAELGQALGKEITLRDFFAAPDVGGLAARLDELSAGDAAVALAMFREDGHEVVL